MDNKLHTPYGVRDYLPSEFYIKRETQSKIEKVFNSYGYQTAASPMFEYIEVFEGKGSLSSKQMYKFIDRDGRILALRPDMTPSIARVAATHYAKDAFPLRFCYVSNVFRYNESYQGKYRELTQAGVELLGVNNEDANTEVIAVAIHSLLAAGLKEFRIDIGEVQFLQGLMEESGLDLEHQQQIQNFVIDKNFVAVKEIINSSSKINKEKSLIADLPMFIGNIDVIERARTLTKSQKAQDALTSLEAIYNYLKAQNLEQYICFDLSAIGNLGYYTGLIFSGFAYGTGFSVLDGGRYDNLMGKFGAETPAVGFSIKMNELLAAIEKQGDTMPQKNIDVFVMYTELGRENAVQTASALRNTGLIVENSLLGSDYELNLSYVKQKGIGGILQFIDEENIIMTDVSQNTQTNVTVSQLLERGAL